MLKSITEVPWKLEKSSMVSVALLNFQGKLVYQLAKSIGRLYFEVDMKIMHLNQTGIY